MLSLSDPNLHYMSMLEHILQKAQQTEFVPAVQVKLCQNWFSIAITFPAEGMRLEGSTPLISWKDWPTHPPALLLYEQKGQISTAIVSSTASERIVASNQSLTFNYSIPCNKLGNDVFVSITNIGILGMQSSTISLILFI